MPCKWGLWSVAGGAGPCGSLDVGFSADNSGQTMKEEGIGCGSQTRTCGWRWVCEWGSSETQWTGLCKKLGGPVVV